MVGKCYLKSVFIALLLLFAIALTAKGWSMDTVRYKNISVDQFIEMMDHKNLVLINVHIPYAGEIPATDLLIPFNGIEQHRSELPSDKRVKIVVYCMSGPMGYFAAETLVNMGYSRVIHFQDGMLSWKKAGKRLVRRSD